MSNSILPAAGNLDIVNANVRADKFNAATNIGVSNSAPTKNFSVGDKFHVSTTDVDAVNITGNLVAQKLKIGNLLVSPTFDFASVSNVGNVTANVIQFANATTGFTTTANVEIGGNITLTSNAQVKVGSNVLAEYTGPHGREPKEMPLKKFPEIAFDASKLDGNDTTNTYVQAGYTVTASTTNPDTTTKSWKAFNDTQFEGNGGWCTPSVYSTSDGSATSSATEFPSGRRGEYIDLKLPKAIKVDYFIIKSRQGVGTATYIPEDAPGEGYLYGSDNGSIWVQIKEFTGLTYGGGGAGMGQEMVQVGSTTFYKYLRLQGTKRSGQNGTNQFLAIGELEYYGTEEPAPPGDLSLDTTLKSTFNSVRSNNYVMYFDGDGFIPGDNTSNNLVTGSNKSVIHHNATYDSTGKYWTLNGSTESNVTTGSLGFEGDAPHTVSTWINASNLDANATTQQLFSIGSGYSEEIVRVDDTQIAANTWHNVTYAYQGEGGSKVTYVDGRKVKEDQVVDSFGNYPPYEITELAGSYSESSGLGLHERGGYKASASSVYQDGYHAYDAFTQSAIHIFIAKHKRFDGGYRYTPGGTGARVYQGPVSTISVPVSGTGTQTISGEWLQLELPHSIYLNDIKYQRENDAWGWNRAPFAGSIVASDDGTNWKTLHNFTGLTDDDVGSANGAAYPSGTGFTGPKPLSGGNFGSIDTEGSNYKDYRYFRFICTHVLKNDAQNDGVNAVYWSVAQLIFVGHKEGDLTRFPEPTRVLKYPHVAMTGPGQRGYVVSTDDDNSAYPIWKVFDDNYWVNGAAEERWQPNTGVYASNGTDTTGGGTTTLADSSTKKGNYVQLESPHKLNVTKYKIYSSTVTSAFTPKKVILLGSNTGGSDWVSIDPAGEVEPTYSGTNADYAATVSFSNTSTYKYHRLVIRAIASQTLPVIYQLQLYGTQENTGTPAIVGGPFAGKVANFRVYDQYLGDERIQEIYDAQKDEFGHKKSSMTFYKGRVGVGTTEPEGALTVVDEPHVMEKFPKYAVSGENPFVEGQGTFMITTAEGNGYEAFNGLIGRSWYSTPERHTRLSEEVDYGAWLKLETPDSIKLKKVEVRAQSRWNQVGNHILGPDNGSQAGRAVACNHDGTRIAIGGYLYSSSTGRVRVYDWVDGSWTLVGNVITGQATNDQFGAFVALSGNGEYLAVCAPREHSNGVVDSGSVRVYYLVGSIWTILPDSGPHTLSVGASNVLDAFVGQGVDYRMGQGGARFSYDGKTLLLSETKYDSGGLTNRGLARVFTYTNGAWSQKGGDLLGDYTQEEFGHGLDMSEDGNHIAIGTKLSGGTSQPPRVEVYQWDGSSAWTQKGSGLTYTDTGDGFGPCCRINNDGTVLAVGVKSADEAEGAWASDNGAVHVYHWNGTAWNSPIVIASPDTGDSTDDYFGHEVGISGDGKRLVISEPLDGTNQGKLHTYEYDGGVWQRKHPKEEDGFYRYWHIGATGYPTDDGYLGYGNQGNNAQSLCLSRDGSTIVAGELGYNNVTISDSGRVRVWNMASNIKSVWGSKDNTNWTKIVSGLTREEATSNVAGVPFSRGCPDYGGELEFKNFDNPEYYKYHAIVGDAYTNLSDIKFYGIRNQGNSILNDGELNLTKSLTVSRIGAPIDTDNTPQRGKLIVEYNTSSNPIVDGIVRDTSGLGNDAFLTGGAYYDTNERALFCDGVNDYIQSSELKNMTGDQNFTYGCWVKIVGKPTPVGNTGAMIITVGNKGSYTKSEFAGIFFQNSRWYNTIGSNGIQSRNGLLHRDVWQHIVMTKAAGTSGKDTMAIYVNGSEVEKVDWNSNGHAAINLGDPVVVQLMAAPVTGVQMVHGWISNIKIYNTVLNSREVRTLYEMGRCDEGYNFVNFEKTRVGIGLANGETPQAALEIRGDLFWSGMLRNLPYMENTILSWQPDFWYDMDDDKYLGDASNNGGIDGQYVRYVYNKSSNWHYQYMNAYAGGSASNGACKIRFINGRRFWTHVGSNSHMRTNSNGTAQWGHESTTFHVACTSPDGTTIGGTKANGSAVMYYQDSASPRVYIGFDSTGGSNAIHKGNLNVSYGTGYGVIDNNSSTNNENSATVLGLLGDDVTDERMSVHAVVVSSASSVASGTRNRIGFCTLTRGSLSEDISSSGSYAGGNKNSAIYWGNRLSFDRGNPEKQFYGEIIHFERNEGQITTHQVKFLEEYFRFKYSYKPGGRGMQFSR